MDGLKVREIKNKEIKNKETIIDGSVISFRRNQVAWLELRREEAQHLVPHMPAFLKVRNSS